MNSRIQSKPNIYTVQLPSEEVREAWFWFKELTESKLDFYLEQKGYHDKKNDKRWTISYIKITAWHKEFEAFQKKMANFYRDVKIEKMVCLELDPKYLDKDGYFDNEKFASENKQRK